MSWLRAQYIQCQRYILYSDRMQYIQCQQYILYSGRMQTKELHYKLNNHQFQKTLGKLLKTNNDSSAKIANTHLKWRKWALNVIKYRYLRIMTDIKTSGRNKKNFPHPYIPQMTEFLWQKQWPTLSDGPPQCKMESHTTVHKKQISVAAFY